MDAKFLPEDAEKGGTVSRASDAGGFAFPRACRLLRRAEYDAVYREGRRRSAREFTVFLRPNSLAVSRFGWSIKKAVGTAVRRNRIRRRLREILRMHLQEIAPGWDVVIHPRGSAAKSDFLALTADLLKLLPKEKSS